MRKNIDLAGADPGHGLLLGDQALFHHVHGDANGGLGRAFAVAGLQHPEFALLDGKLHVLHVAVVLFQGFGDFLQLHKISGISSAI